MGGAAGLHPPGSVGPWEESTFCSSFCASDTKSVPALAIGHTCPSFGDRTLWVLVVSSNSRELPEFPALSGHGIAESLGWEGPLKFICKEQGHLQLEQGAEVEHFQGNLKHSRLGTVEDGKDPEAEPGAVGVIFPLGPGVTRAAPSGEGDWEIPHTLQPFFQLEIFSWSWNKLRFPPRRAKSVDISV